MTDDEIRKLVQKSMVKTSGKFTDELMHKVELQKKSEEKIKMHFLIACVVCMVLLLFIFRVPLPTKFLHVSLHRSSIMIRVLGSLFVFIMLNRLMALRSELLRTRKNIAP